MLSAELLPALTDTGLNVPVAPVGNPVTLRLIDPLKPLTAVVLTVYGVPVLPPTVTVWLDGVADTVKLGLGASRVRSGCR